MDAGFVNGILAKYLLMLYYSVSRAFFLKTRCQYQAIGASTN